MTQYQRILVHATGGPDAMQFETGELPARQSGETLVAVKAAGVNFLDTQLRSGLYARPLPVRLGGEGAGVVLEADPASDFRAGDRVAWALADGAYATHAIVPTQRLIKLPDALSFELAAAGFMQGLTAHYLAYSAYALKSGDVCVVQSAAGGVGILLCQMARRIGARPIGTVSSEAKLEAAASAGADPVVIYPKEDAAAIAKEITGGRGADAVYDAVGKETFETNLSALKTRGTLVIYGEASGEVPPFDIRRLSPKSLHLTRTGLGAYIADAAEFQWRAGDVMGWLASGELKQKFISMPLEQAAEAHRALESRASTGKIILIPPEA